MPRVLNKTRIEWGKHPEEFECRLLRSEQTDPNDLAQTIIVWSLTTTYDVLTAEGERISQHETWKLPATAVTVVEDIRTRVTNRLKKRNDIP